MNSLRSVVHGISVVKLSGEQSYHKPDTIAIESIMMIFQLKHDI